MTGDDRARFCAQCQKPVYDLSNMTADEAVALIRSREGKLCARFYRRIDGTILTADCPVGARQAWLSFRRLLGVAAALALAGLLVPLCRDPDPSTPTPFRARKKVEQAWHDAVTVVKGWLGYPQPRTFVMGEICIAPQPTKPLAVPQRRESSPSNP
jgi:hypothetical protein